MPITTVYLSRNDYRKSYLLVLVKLPFKTVEYNYIKHFKITELYKTM